MQRVLDRLAQTAEHQTHLDAEVARLVRENEELREEANNLRDRVSRLTEQRAETAQALRALAAHVTGVRSQVLRQAREAPPSE
jgi:regulator of replication initiation timing